MYWYGTEKKIPRGGQLLAVKMKEVAKMSKMLGKWFRMLREMDSALSS